MKKLIVLYVLVILSLVLSSVSLIHSYHPGTHYVIQKTPNSIGPDGYELKEVPN